MIYPLANSVGFGTTRDLTGGRRMALRRTLRRCLAFGVVGVMFSSRCCFALFGEFTQIVARVGSLVLIMTGTNPSIPDGRWHSADL
jgi:hypothetical protein